MQCVHCLNQAGHRNEAARLDAGRCKVNVTHPPLCPAPPPGKGPGRARPTQSGSWQEPGEKNSSISSPSRPPHTSAQSPVPGEPNPGACCSCPQPSSLRFKRCSKATATPLVFSSLGSRKHNSEWLKQYELTKEEPGGREAFELCGQEIQWPQQGPSVSSEAHCVGFIQMPVSPSLACH